MQSSGSTRSVVCSKLALSILFAVVVVLYGIAVTAWIHSSDTDERRQQLLDYQFNLECFSCLNEERTEWSSEDKCQSIKRNCSLEGWKIDDSLPPSCAQKQSVQAYVKEQVVKEYEKRKKAFEEKELTKPKAEYLAKAKNSFTSAANRQIVHWSPSSVAPPDKDGWISVKNFSKDGFPLTPGPIDSHQPEGIKLTEDGLYLVYARLTFACNKTSKKPKSIVMEIVVHEAPYDDYYVLLQDKQMVTCDQAEDSITLYQSGIFRLQKGYVIITRYKAPRDVALSRQGRIFKSNVGLLRMGLL